jgi:pimeloyl-ACP methyl ester carboxylesterase
MASRLLPAAERVARFAMNQSGMKSRWQNGGDMDLHFYEGSGRGPLPTVVMLHGLGAAGSSFAGVAARLRPHVRRVLVPELPGHGSSVYPNRRVTPDALLEGVSGVLDDLLDEPAILYGNSLGGALALQYAIRRPERVRALVLASPAGARLEEDEWHELVASFAIKDRREAKRFIERVYHRPPWFLALFAHEFPELLSKPAVRDILESATPDHAPHPDALAALPMPTLLLWGRSERLLPASALAYFRKHLPPHAVIEEPEGFGHAPQLEEPTRIAARIVAFAREAESPRAKADIGQVVATSIAGD